MSTVPEVIIARHCDIRVLAISLVTNVTLLEPAPRGDDALVQKLDERSLADIMEAGKANHQEVLEASRMAVKDLQVRSVCIMRSLSNTRLSFTKSVLCSVIHGELSPKIDAIL